MQVAVLSVQKIFGRDVHYAVPLYQRPYVWNERDQWNPLWEDLHPLAELVATGTQGRAHFLGASVQETIPVPSGATETRRVIDGQQRLTTLQLLLKAFHDLVWVREFKGHATALKKLLVNDDDLILEAHKKLKLWPTRADQEDYRHVMDAHSPEDLLQALGKPGAAYPLTNHNIANAYLFFHREIGKWLAEDGESDLESRVRGLYGALRDQLRIVVIDLDEKDDAQAIFETLNARGAPLLSADLVKNALLGQLHPDEAEEAYRRYWQGFDSEGAFWRELVGRGHAQRARIETFLQHALTLLTGEMVSAGHLYNAYRDYAESDASGTAISILRRFKKLGDIYRRLQQPQPDKRLADFFYRLQTLDIVSAWPFILALYDRYEDQPKVVHAVLTDLESYLVRRMVCRLSTRGYSKVFPKLTSLIAQQDNVVEAVRHALLEGDAEVDRFPRDNEFETAWTTFPLYENLTRPRMRLLLEAMEETLRTEFAEEIAAPKRLTIEHVMPQGWREHWKLPQQQTPEERDRTLHTIGNLTLLNGKFNPYQSNRPWSDGGNPDNGKRANLHAHTILVLNRQLCDQDEWNEMRIRARSQELFEMARKVWPPPPPLHVP